jgi:hypothetical protein
MTIEVRQLVIKSSVAEQENSPLRNDTQNIDLDALKRELLIECKQIVNDSIANARRR